MVIKKDIDDNIRVKVISLKMGDYENREYADYVSETGITIACRTRRPNEICVKFDNDKYMTSIWLTSELEILGE